MMSGGPAKVLQLSKSRMNFFDFNPDPTIRHSFWTLVIGAIPQFIYLTITQASVQRINSTPTMRTAKIIFYIAAPVYSLIWMLSMFEGLAVFAYFSNIGCDPLAAKKVQNLNQIIPFTMMELFSDMPGLPGLFIAALSAASLSTISSGLGSLAAITYEDFVKVFCGNLKDSTGANTSKIIVVLYGLISVGFAFLLSNVEGPLGQIMASFMGAISGPETGLFLTSIFFRKATRKGMIFGTLCGTGFVLWISCGQNFLASVPKQPYLPLGSTEMCDANTTGTLFNSSARLSTSLDQSTHTANNMLNVTSSTTYQEDVTGNRSGLQTLYSISYMYFNLIGTIVVIVVGIATSCFTQADCPDEVNDLVMHPWHRFLPKCFNTRRKKLYEVNSSELWYVGRDKENIQEKL